MPDSKSENKVEPRFDVTTAILVDGGFYKKRAYHLWGAKTPQARAEELQSYCMKLLKNKYENRINPTTLKKLLKGEIALDSLTDQDFRFNVEQKGVDMRIGVDITSLALKKQAQQIILISGDSDFVPASKQARREGIDMILAPMGATIKSSLHEHIDGMINAVKDPLATPE